MCRFTRDAHSRGASVTLIHLTYVLTKCHPTFEFYLPTFTIYRPTFTIYRPTFSIYQPTYEIYRHPPAKEKKRIHTQTVCECESFVAQSPLHSTNTHSMHPLTFVL
jgi:hypothetical protein